MLVAKAHKISDRLNDKKIDRLSDKDAARRLPDHGRPKDLTASAKRSERCEPTPWRDL